MSTLALVVGFFRALLHSKYVPTFPALEYDAHRSAAWAAMIETAVRL